MNINYGCGENKLEGFVNVDIEESTKPDLVCDLRRGPFPYENDSVDKIYMIHCIEHVEFDKWPLIFNEFYRVLKLGGELLLAYPEFSVCAKYFIDDFRGNREFWRKTLYGRQLYPGDYHITPMVSIDLAEQLITIGFDNAKFKADPDEEFNFWMYAVKGAAPLTRDDTFRNEIFGVEPLLANVTVMNREILNDPLKVAQLI